MSELTKRDERIDTVKIMLIFAIYVFHCAGAAGRLYPFFGSYHVPAFFMVSGFWALNRAEQSVWQFVKNALSRYLIPWRLWVVIYTLYHAIANGYGVMNTLAVFWRYFSSVRGNYIGGMWFILPFFLVTLLYHLIAKLTAKLPLKSRGQAAWVNLLICFVIYFVFRMLHGGGKVWLFSVSQVPEHLFYYAAGTVAYGLWKGFQNRTQSNPARSRWITAAVAAVSLGWMAVVYFEKTGFFWGWTESLPMGVLDFLPELVTVVLALMANFWLAGFISGPYLASLGRLTLFFCCAEAFMKNILCDLGQLIGLSVQPASPVTCVLFCAIALLAARYTVVPFTQKVSGRVTAKLKL